jgi:hypothetical protein
LKTKHRLAIVAAGLVALGTLALFSSGKAWRLTAFFFRSRADTKTQEMRRPARIGDSADAQVFDRILIRNIATVPFVELFDLLRSAPARTRDGWIKQLDEMPDGPQRNAALSSFYKTFVQIDPHTAADSVARLHDKYGRYLAVEATIGAAPLSAMREMADMLVKLPSDTIWGARRDFWGDVISDWSAVDPVAAAHFLEEHPDVSADRSMILLSNWAKVDPEAAKAWMERQPASLQTEDAIVGLVGGWSDHNETNAAAFVVAHASEENFKRASNNLADNLFHRSPDEARTFLLRLPNEARAEAISEIVSMTTGVVLGLSESWERPPEDVAKWILTLPKESWNKAMENVLANWDSRDETGLARWISQLPIETRDQVAADYCSARDLRHPEQAIAIGLTIKDATLRDQSLRKVMNRWCTESPDEARAVLKEIPLSEAQRKYLTGLLPTE